MSRSTVKAFKTELAKMSQKSLTTLTSNTIRHSTDRVCNLCKTDASILKVLTWMLPTTLLSRCTSTSLHTSIHLNNSRWLANKNDRMVGSKFKLNTRFNKAINSNRKFNPTSSNCISSLHNKIKRSASKWTWNKMKMTIFLRVE